MVTNVCASQDYGPMMIIGRYSDAEVFSDGETTKLKIGKNPMNLIDTGDNKVLICAGDYSYPKAVDSFKVKEKASLSVYDPDSKAFNTKYTFDGAIAGYCINETKSVIWLFTKKGTYDGVELQAMLYRIDLKTFEKVELVLDDDLSKVTLSGDEKWLALASPGLPDADFSTIYLLDPSTLNLYKKYDVDKNPAFVTFNDNNSSILIACEGNSAKAAGIWLIDLANQKVLLNKPLGTAARGFITAEDNSRYYGVTNAGDPGKYMLTAFDATGVLFKTGLDFIPQGIQKRPDSDQLFLLDKENKILVINDKTGEVIKEIFLKYALDSITFIQGDSTAYIYSAAESADSYLLGIDLDRLELKAAIKIGGSFKSFGASFKEAWSWDNVGTSEFQLLNELKQADFIMTNEVMNNMYNQLKGLKDIIAHSSQNKIYMLNKNTDAVSVYDVAQQKIIKKITGLAGAEYFLLSKNQKYLIVITMTKVILVNTSTYKIDFQEVVNGTKFLGMEGGRIARTITPSFNPDGSLLFVGNSFLKFIVIDLNTAKKIDAIPSKILDLDPYFYWM
jgi:DNA-binding beta-propeller fold protein YncE